MTQTHSTLTRRRMGAAELGYTDSGGLGDPMVLMHGGGLADWFTPLAAEPALESHRVIRLVRAGYTGAPAPDGLTIADHAGHAAALLQQIGAAPAHVVAHSSACVIALQLAFDNPGLIRTLSLVEPPLIDVLAAPEDAGTLGPAIGAVMGAVARGDLPAAFDKFMTAVCGAGYRGVMTETLGAGVVEDAVDRYRYFLTGEMAAVGAWAAGPDDFARLRMPVLLVRGAASPPPVHRMVTRLAGLIPVATVATVPDAGHLLPLTASAELGVLLSGFSRG